MIIKSMSRKGKGETHFSQLYDYIRERAVSGYELWHNFGSFQPDRNQVIGDFIQNSHHLRNSPRHNILYHEIISLRRTTKGLDHGQLEILHDLANQYLAARAGGQLAFGAIHLDKDHHAHIHLIISANELDSKRRVRLKKFEFLQIQKDLETYLHQRYPELDEQIIYNKPWEKSRDISDPEVQLKQRTVSKSKKDQLRDSLETIFQHAPNYQEAGKALQHFGISLEERGKHLVAQQGKLRCRIKTLRLDQDYQVFQKRVNEAEKKPEKEADPVQQKANKEPSAPKEKSPDKQNRGEEKDLDPLEKLKQFWKEKDKKKEAEKQRE